MPDAFYTDALRVMELQVDQGWNTSTTEALARQFLVACGKIDAFAAVVDAKAQEEDVVFNAASITTDARIVVIQQMCHWSDGTCDLMALDFMRHQNLMGEYADFLQIQADDENAIGNVAGVSRDGDGDGPDTQ